MTQIEEAELLAEEGLADNSGGLTQGVSEPVEEVADEGGFGQFSGREEKK